MTHAIPYLIVFPIKTAKSSAARSSSSVSLRLPSLFTLGNSAIRLDQERALLQK
jgi:hypothetical protein